MSKSYSNKALPSGTVLREWRLEEVLGVGGFGIVYKGRGIYFDELVAIKEYFPSSISERKDGDTVVPIDSDAEEVHALGLKKFVEEAKLLWNLSTPTRHPNIVSVRSLFEIHGTAYMVMDFEDGVSLSKLLKDGRRFNEASLMTLIKPIAEGLDRAHRVGVLHRDIKPPNILVNEDGRPVLIDFGSARFESGDATSTKVTFHTPPYAAIEQYVKTYSQGPWTDIYALGVVLYECVAGEKPPEVLERMHGGLGTPLADRDWPGYSRAFLRAIDAAMTIRPDDRPQSIPHWLAMFDEKDEASVSAAPPTVEMDEDATRISTFGSHPAQIIPVAPPPPGFSEVGKVDTPVPDDTSQVQFKRLGHDTNASKPIAPAEAAEPAEVASEQGEMTGPEKASPLAATSPEGAKPVIKSTAPASRRLLLFGGAALAAALVAGGGWYLASSGSQMTRTGQVLPFEEPSEEVAELPVAISGVDGLAEAVKALAVKARATGAPIAAVRELNAAGSKLDQLHSGFATLADESQRQNASRDMESLAKTAGAAFAAGLARDAQAKAGRVASAQAWADPGNPGAAAGQPPDRQRLAGTLRSTLAQVRAASTEAAKAGEAGPALAAANKGLAAFRSFNAAYYRALKPTDGSSSQAVEEISPSAAVQAAVEEARPLSSASGFTVPPAKLQQFNSIVSQAHGIAANVIKMGKKAQLPSDPSDDDKSNYRTLQANIKSAQGYEDYLNTLTNSMRGVKNDGEVDRLTRQAEQTQRYLAVLLSRSTAASR